MTTTKAKSTSKSASPTHRPTAAKPADAPAKKPPAKKATCKKSLQVKLDLDNLTASKVEMAAIVGLAASNITALLQNGGMVAGEDGRLNVRDNVSAYCRRMRERKGDKGANDIERETAYWKLENIKLKNRDWRMQRDRETALEIIRTLSRAMTNLREQAKMNPALVEAFDDMLSAIGQVNVDTVALTVEGECEEEEA